MNASIGTEGLRRSSKLAPMRSENGLRTFLDSLIAVPPQRPRRRVYRTLRIPRSALERQIRCQLGQ